MARLAADDGTLPGFPGTDALMATEGSNGLGFTGVYGKWLTEEGPGAEPNAFNNSGAIKPTITVIFPNSGETEHPSPTVSGVRKWDNHPSIYVFHFPSDHGKDILQRALLRIERVLCDPNWLPVITGGQRPSFRFDGEIHIDNQEQFPKNYALVLTYRVTGMRFTQ